jgi:hypothetical protein
MRGNMRTNTQYVAHFRPLRAAHVAVLAHQLPSAPCIKTELVAQGSSERATCTWQPLGRVSGLIQQISLVSVAKTPGLNGGIQVISMDWAQNASRGRHRQAPDG